MGFSAGTLSKYITTVNNKPVTVTINGRTYEETYITAGNYDYASTTTENGAVSFKEFFFVPGAEDAAGKWYTATGIATGALTNRDISSLHIPAFITDIQPNALNCNGLGSIAVETGHTTFRVDGDNLMHTNGTLVRRITTDTAAFYTVPNTVSAIQDGAFSNSGYTAIVTDLYHSGAWGAANAVIFNTADLGDMTIQSISGNTIDGYTVTLGGEIPTTDVVYHVDYHPDDASLEAVATNQVLELTGDTGTIDKAHCQPCSKHGNRARITLTSYWKYAYGLLMTDGTLEIHNCYVVQTADGLIHQYKNGEHTHLTGDEAATAGVRGVYRLPDVDVNISIPTTWTNVQNWDALPKENVTSVEVIDSVSGETSNWFTDMTNAVTMDLTKLDTISANTFTDCTDLKVVFYEGDGTDAPWGAENALIVDNALGVGITYDATAAGDYTFKFSDTFADNGIRVFKTDGTYTDIPVANALFTVPAESSDGDPAVEGYKGCYVTLTEIKTYRFATTEVSADNKTVHLRIHQGNRVPQPGKTFTSGGTTYTVAQVYSWPNGYDDSDTNGKNYANPKDANGEAYPAWVTWTSTSATSTSTPAEAFTAVTVADSISPTTMRSWFWDFSSCQAFNLSKLDTSNVTNFSDTFRGCAGLTAEKLAAINNGEIDLSSATNTSGMFRNCTALTDLTGITFVDNNSANVISNARNMFRASKNITNVNLSALDFSTETVDFYHMFHDCTALSSVTFPARSIKQASSVQAMFWQCKALQTVDLSFLGTVSAASDIFNGCTQLRTIIVGANFKVSGTHNMFPDCTALLGSNGTKYIKDNNNQTFAIIDGGTSSPGYLTLVGDFKLQSGIDNVSIVSRTKADNGSYTVTLAGLPENATAVTLTYGGATTNATLTGSTFTILSGHGYDPYTTVTISSVTIADTADTINEEEGNETTPTVQVTFDTVPEIAAATAALDGENLVITLTAAENASLPGSVTVKLGDTEAAELPVTDGTVTVTGVTAPTDGSSIDVVITPVVSEPDSDPDQNENPDPDQNQNTDPDQNQNSDPDQSQNSDPDQSQDPDPEQNQNLDPQQVSDDPAEDPTDPTKPADMSTPPPKGSEEEEEPAEVPSDLPDGEEPPAEE